MIDTRPAPERDRYGRYLLPHPETSKSRAWTRATTLASTIDDPYHLTKWKMRMVAVGVAQHAALRAQVASATDERQLDRLADEAIERAGGSDRAALGTALHAMCEAIDLGEKCPEDFAEHEGDLRAYVQGLADHQITILPAWVERIVVNPAADAAGTLDRIVTYQGRNYIADIKTGSLEFALGDIAQQLAIYANASGAWCGANTYEPLPDVSTDTALVLHLPAGEARFALWHIDIVRGWELVQLSRTVRAARKAKPGKEIEL